MATPLGIDLGTWSVKVSVHTGRRADGARGYARRVPVGEDGPTLGARLATLAGLLRDLGAQESPVYAVALPTEHCATRLLRLPFTDRARIEKTIPFALEGFVPFDLEDFLLDWRALGAEADGGARVFCAMASTIEVKGLLDALDAVDVDPKYLLLDGDALGAVGSGAGVQAVLDLGHSRTLVTLCKDGQVLAARALSVGGAALTAALAQHLQVDLATAEALKHAVGLDPDDAGPLPVQASFEEDEEERTEPALRPPPDVEAVARALREALLPLLFNLRATLIALEDEHGAGIDEVVLAGGGAALRGLVPALTQDLGVPVRRHSPRVQGEGAPESYVLAQSLALHAAGLIPAAELNFRKGPFAFKGDVEVIRAVMGYALVAAVFFLVVGGGGFLTRYLQFQQAIAGLEQQIASTVTEALPELDPERVAEPSMAKAVMQEQALDAATRAQALGAVIGQPPPVLSALLNLSEYAPPHPDVVIDIKELTLTDELLTFKAETNSYEAAANIETSLQRFAPFQGARKGDEKKSGANVAFTMNIPLNTGDAAEDGEEG